MTDHPLSGRVALVTGAASGIGRAVAARLEREGMDVLAVDLRPDDAGPGVPFEADLTDPDANARAVAAALDRFGRLDVVVPNAGVQHVAPIDEFPDERWQTIVGLLLSSPFYLAKHAWPALRQADSGRFIAIASVHGLVASPYKAVKQLIEPDEVAAVVAFLAGPDGRAFTGVPVTMDHGWTAR